jgi:hypothetical protein
MSSMEWLQLKADAAKGLAEVRGAIIDKLKEEIQQRDAKAVAAEAENQSLAERLVKAVKTIEERDEQIEMWKRRVNELGDLVRQRNQVIDDIQTYAHQRDDAEARTVFKFAKDMMARDKEIAELRKQLAERQLPVVKGQSHIECSGCGGLFHQEQTQANDPHWQGGRYFCTGCVANEELVETRERQAEQIRNQAELIRTLEASLRERTNKCEELVSMLVTTSSLVDRISRERDSANEWSIQNKARYEGWVARCEAAEAKLKQYEQDKPTGKQPREIWLAFGKCDLVLRYWNDTKSGMESELAKTADPDMFDVWHFREVV